MALKPLKSQRGSGLTGLKPLKQSSTKSKKKGKRGNKWWNAPQRAVDVIAADAKSLATGIPKEAIKSGKAAATILSPVSSTKDKKKAAKVLAGQAGDFAKGVEEIIPNPESLPYGDVSLVQIKDGDVRFWVKGGEKGDSARAAEAWKTRPITSLLTGIGVAAPAAGAVSVSRIAASIRRSNRTINRATALKLARRESRNPGFLAAQGIKGGLEPRTLKSEIPGGKTREVELHQARSAIGRRGQEMADAVSKALPKGGPLSERRKANRQLARDMAETDRRNTARAANLMHPVRKVAFGPTGSKRGNQSLLAYALQTPRGADPLQGPKAVAARFDQILKEGGYEIDGLRHALTPTERKRLTAERSRIRKALANAPDPDDFALALDAMEQAAKESDAIARYIVQGRALGVSPTEAARLDKIFDERRDLLSRYLGIEGEARGFFPHRSRFELRDSKGTAAAARSTGTVLGRPQPKVNMKKNRLKLFHSGRVDTDPRVVEQTLAAHTRFLETEQRRRELFDEGVPLDMLTGKEKGGYLIRDPDRAAAKLSPEERALHDPRQQLIDLIDKGDEDGALNAWRDTWLRRDDDPATDEWMAAPDSIRWVPKDVVDKRLTRLVTVDPDAKVRPILGTLNAIARVATIQGKPARYLSTNTIQNLVNSTITSPTAAVRGASSQAGLLRAIPAIDKMWKALRLPDGLRSRNPELYRLIAAETGDAQATAGLPSIRSSANKTQKVEAKATGFQHMLGDKLGSVADTPYRAAMWMKHARRLGFKSDAQIKKLLTSEEPHVMRARRQVMQSTRDDMYDFNRISVWERETIARFFFLWPLVRAGIRYPVTYTRDYPVRAGAASSLTFDEENAGDTEARDLFKFRVKGGEIDTAWGMPHGISVQQLENLQRVINGDLSAIGYMLSPPLSETGKAIFGFERPFGQRAERFGRNMVPGFSGAQDTYREGVKGIPAIKRFVPQKPKD